MDIKEEIEIYTDGIIHCSICTNAKSTERIEQLVNMENPTGIGSKWRISKNPTFSNGPTNPCPCEQKPETHKHYLMEC